jgi:hypothetical protein
VVTVSLCDSDQSPKRLLVLFIIIVDVVVTDLLRAFLGNTSVNTFPWLRNNRQSSAVLCCAKPQRDARRQLCEHLNWTTVSKGHVTSAFLQ